MGSVKVRSGQELLWEFGSLSCIKKVNGKSILTVKSKNSTLKNSYNKWIFKAEFDFISEPDDKLLCIVRKDNTSRILNITSGKYVTGQDIYVNDCLGSGKYNCIKDGQEGTLDLNTGKFVKI